MTAARETTRDPWAAGAVWAVGRFSRAGSTVLWPSTRAERASAAAAAQRRLAALGIGAGDRVALLSLMSDGVQFVPYEDAIRASHIVVTPADSTTFDANRVAFIAGQPGVKAVIGITTDTLDGFGEIGVDPSMLAPVPVVVCEWSAAPRLEAAGIRPMRCLVAGPVLAMECPARAGAHVDGQAWQVATDGAEVLLTPRLPDHGRDGGGVHCGLSAAVITDACECGSSDPRLVVA